MTTAQYLCHLGRLYRNKTYFIVLLVITNTVVIFVSQLRANIFIKYIISLQNIILWTMVWDLSTIIVLLIDRWPIVFPTKFKIRLRYSATIARRLCCSYQRFKSHVVFGRPEKLSMGTTSFNLLRRVRISLGSRSLCII